MDVLGTSLRTVDTVGEARGLRGQILYTYERQKGCMILLETRL